MVKRLLSLGWTVRVFSRSLRAEDVLIELGAEHCDSLQQAATGSRVVCLTLPDDTAVEQVCQEVLPQIRPGQVVVDFGTSSPDLSATLAELANSRQVQFFEAPVSGGPQGAITGSLSIMVGASEAECEQFQDLLSALGQATYFGKGKGQIAKLCNQIVVASHIAGLSEAVRLAEKYEISLENLFAALGRGAASSWVLTEKGPKILSQNWEAQGAARTQLKDLDLASNAAQAANLSLPVTDVVRAWFEALVSKGLGDLDHSALGLASPPSVRVFAH